MTSGEQRQTEAGPVAMDPSKEPGTEPVPLSVTLLREIQDQVTRGLETSNLPTLYDILNDISRSCVQAKMHVAKVMWERSMSGRPTATTIRTLAPLPKARTADDLLSDL